MSIISHQRSQPDPDEGDVVTTGVAPEAVHRPIPANVHVRAFVPFADLLARVSVAVTNGGFGSMQAALAHGIPLVVAGMSEDKPDIAARVAWSGAGVRLPFRSPAPDVLRNAVHDVLDQPDYRQRAEAFRREIEATDAPNQAANLIEALAATGRPVTIASDLGDVPATAR